MRYEIRFYDALDNVKVAIELTAVDRHAAEQAARLYLRDDVADHLIEHRLIHGATREIPS